MAKDSILVGPRRSGRYTSSVYASTRELLFAGCGLAAYSNTATREGARKHEPPQGKIPAGAGLLELCNEASLDRIVNAAQAFPSREVIHWSSMDMISLVDFAKRTHIPVRFEAFLG